MSSSSLTLSLSGFQSQTQLNGEYKVDGSVAVMKNGSGEFILFQSDDGKWGIGVAGGHPAIAVSTTTSRSGQWSEQVIQWKPAFVECGPLGPSELYFLGAEPAE